MTAHTSGFDELETSRRLHHRLQFCSRLELRHRSFGKLNVATEIVRVEVLNRRGR